MGGGGGVAGGESQFTGQSPFLQAAASCTETIRRQMGAASSVGGGGGGKELGGWSRPRVEAMLVFGLIRTSWDALLGGGGGDLGERRELEVRGGGGVSGTLELIQVEVWISKGGGEQPDAHCKSFVMRMYSFLLPWMHDDGWMMDG